MKREILVIRPEKQRRRIGVLPTSVQRDRTKYRRKAKHRHADGQDHSAADFPEIRGTMAPGCVIGSSQRSAYGDRHSRGIGFSRI